jgi:type I polyketide synthase PikAII
MAVQALRNNECTQALAGGVNVVLSPEGSVYFSRLQAISPTGKCHTFSAQADGFVRSEGCGIIVLKRLSDAETNGDKILGLIRGSAINQDGNSQGFTAPNGPSQQDVIRKALLQADMDPASVDYIEAHGTGTELGDPIEISALAKVIGESRNGHGPLKVGSVKTNIGHAEGAAGIAGLIKVLLSMKHGLLPGNIHLHDVNPYVELTGSPFYLVEENTPWDRLLDGEGQELPRRAGISSRCQRG